MTGVLPRIVELRTRIKCLSDAAGAAVSVPHIVRNASGPCDRTPQSGKFPSFVRPTGFRVDDDWADPVIANPVQLGS